MGNFISYPRQTFLCYFWKQEDSSKQVWNDILDTLNDLEIYENTLNWCVLFNINCIVLVIAQRVN